AAELPSVVGPAFGRMEIWRLMPGAAAGCSLRPSGSLSRALRVRCLNGQNKEAPALRRIRLAGFATSAEADFQKAGRFLSPRSGTGARLAAEIPTAAYRSAGVEHSHLRAPG